MSFFVVEILPLLLFIIFLIVMWFSVVLLVEADSTPKMIIFGAMLVASFILMIVSIATIKTTNYYPEKYDIEAMAKDFNAHTKKKEEKERVRLEKKSYLGVDRWTYYVEDVSEEKEEVDEYQKYIKE